MTHNMCSRFRRTGQTPILYRATLILVALAYMTIAVSCHRNGAGGCKICDAGGKGDLATVKALLKGNPKLVFSKDDKGNTPLHWAASHGHRDVVELLLANGADVNAKSETTVVLSEPSLGTYQVNGGSTPYHMAEAKGHKDVAELLRQHGGHE